jgi:hypothetical protein
MKQTLFRSDHQRGRRNAELAWSTALAPRSGEKQTLGEQAKNDASDRFYTAKILSRLLPAIGFIPSINWLLALRARVEHCCIY